MALATSGNISLTDIRDFYGQSGSISLTTLRKGTGIVPDPEDYGVSGSVISSASGSCLPVALYPQGGVSTSLDTEANTAIDDSGSISLTDFYSGYRVVNPTVSSVSLDSQTHQTNYWAGNTATAYKGFYIYSYDSFGSYPNYGQLMNVVASAWLGGTFTAQATVTFQVSHAGIYTIRCHTSGNEGTGYFSISGAGVSSGSQSDQAVTLNCFEQYEVTLAASSNITIQAKAASGTAGIVTYVWLQTNCNFFRHPNSTNSSTYNNMFTQS